MLVFSRQTLANDEWNTKITDRTRRMIETRFPDLNFDWLLTGEGEMLREDAPRPMAQQNNHHLPGARMENNYYMRGGAEGGNIAAQNLEVKAHPKTHVQSFHHICTVCQTMIYMQT